MKVRRQRPAASGDPGAREDARRRGGRNGDEAGAGPIQGGGCRPRSKARVAGAVSSRPRGRLPQLLAGWVGSPLLCAVTRACVCCCCPQEAGRRDVCAQRKSGMACNCLGTATESLRARWLLLPPPGLQGHAAGRGSALERAGVAATHGAPRARVLPPPRGIARAGAGRGARGGATRRDARGGPLFTCVGCV
jgi:hypothetical protein